MIIKGWFEFMIGIGLILVAFFDLETESYYYNNIIIGILIALVGSWLGQTDIFYSWILPSIGFLFASTAKIPILLEGVGLYCNNIVFGSILIAVGMFALYKKFYAENIE